MARLKTQYRVSMYHSSWPAGLGHNDVTILTNYLVKHTTVPGIIIVTCTLILFSFDIYVTSFPCPSGVRFHHVNS